MRTNLGDKGLLSDDDRPIIALREGSRRYRGRNPGKARILCYRVDGGVVNVGRRCDYAVGLPELNKVLLVELKGKNLRTACAQIVATIQRLQASLASFVVCARIVVSRVQRPDLRSAAMINLERQIACAGGDVRKASGLMEETY